MRFIIRKKHHKEGLTCSNCGYHSNIIYHIFMDEKEGKKVYTKPLDTNNCNHVSLCPDCCIFFEMDDLDMIENVKKGGG